MEETLALPVNRSFYASGQYAPNRILVAKSSFASTKDG